MINDYEYPKCHNRFPSSNKILYDERTAEHPVPLNQSRMIDLNSENIPNRNNHNSNNNEPQHNQDIRRNQNIQNDQPNYPMEVEHEIPQVNIQEQNININPSIRKPPSGEFPDVFECDICHEMFYTKEKQDHMLWNNLEKEENNRRNNYQASQEEIAQQKEIERNRRANQNRNNNNHTSNINYNPNRNNNNIGNDVPNFLNNFRDALSQQQTNEIRYNSGNHRKNNRQQGNRPNTNVVYLILLQLLAQMVKE